MSELLCERKANNQSQINFKYQLFEEGKTMPREGDEKQEIFENVRVEIMEDKQIEIPAKRILK